MNTCSQALCRNTDLAVYKLGLRHQFTLLCGSCHASLSAIGMPLIPVERREASLPVLVERRKAFRPAWLDRLQGRDETGRMAS
jgi:hypothetical protein